ncbi:hypothetical protein QJS04_geneDACA012710 [Acorus gramineus]|uniref:Uncharacterized protein n=1 Tax=Acorus gramineus TaxID=55184 RepID=A0AAV9B4K1_ACOGR|nr:hypothetical protein QJS04_geneDACA012710 [Acorus gramineus]
MVSSSPNNEVEGMHMVEMEGPFVLQVDEIVNISALLRDRYHDAGAGFKRCLKLSMTDGGSKGIWDGIQTHQRA